MSSDDEVLRLPRYLGACILSYKSSTHPIDISCARICPCNSFLFMICNLPSLPVQSIITTAPLVWCFQNISCCKCCGGMEDAQYIVLVMHLYLRICSASPNIEPGITIDDRFRGRLCILEWSPSKVAAGWHCVHRLPVCRKHAHGLRESGEATLAALAIPRYLLKYIGT